MRNATLFRERFNRWKAGEKVYNAGKPVELPAYGDGTPEDELAKATVSESTVPVVGISPQARLLGQYFTEKNDPVVGGFNPMYDAASDTHIQRTLPEVEVVGSWAPYAKKHNIPVSEAARYAYGDARGGGAVRKATESVAKPVFDVIDTATMFAAPELWSIAHTAGNVYNYATNNYEHQADPLLFALEALPGVNLLNKALAGLTRMYARNRLGMPMFFDEFKLPGAAGATGGFRAMPNAQTAQNRILGRAPKMHYNGDIEGERFGQLISDAGSEKMVYLDASNPDRVLKVYDARMNDTSSRFNPSELVDEMHEGWVTTPDGKYYRVTSLPKYTDVIERLNAELSRLASQYLQENGWNPHLDNNGILRSATKDGMTMNDITDGNWAYDNNGNLRLIDNNVIKGGAAITPNSIETRIKRISALPIEQRVEELNRLGIPSPFATRLDNPKIQEAAVKYIREQNSIKPVKYGETELAIVDYLENDAEYRELANRVLGELGAKAYIQLQINNIRDTRLREKPSLSTSGLATTEIDGATEHPYVYLLDAEDVPVRMHEDLHASTKLGLDMPQLVKDHNAELHPFGYVDEASMNPESGNWNMQKYVSFHDESRVRALTTKMWLAKQNMTVDLMFARLETDPLFFNTLPDDTKLLISTMTPEWTSSDINRHPLGRGNKLKLKDYITGALSISVPVVTGFGAASTLLQPDRSKTK